MNNKYLIYAGLLFLFFLVHSSAVKVFQGSSFVPELLLLAVIIFAAMNSLPETLWFSFGAGFLLEIFSAEFFGAHIFALLICGITAYLATRNLTAQELAVPTAVFLVIGATLLRPALVWVYQAGVSSLDLATAIPVGVFLNGELFYTVLVNLAIFYLLRAGIRYFPALNK